MAKHIHIHIGRTKDRRIKDQRFTPAMINKLRAEYGSIQGIDPSSENYKKLVSLLNSLDQETLKQLADAKIKFISGMALNRLKR